MSALLARLAARTMSSDAGRSVKSFSTYSRAESTATGGESNATSGLTAADAKRAGEHLSGQWGTIIFFRTIARRSQVTFRAQYIFSLVVCKTFPNNFVLSTQLHRTCIVYPHIIAFRAQFPFIYQGVHTKPFCMNYPTYPARIYFYSHIVFVLYLRTGVTRSDSML